MRARPCMSIRIIAWSGATRPPACTRAGSFFCGAALLLNSGWGGRVRRFPSRGKLEKGLPFIFLLRRRRIRRGRLEPGFLHNRTSFSGKLSKLRRAERHGEPFGVATGAVERVCALWRAIGEMSERYAASDCVGWLIVRCEVCYWKVLQAAVNFLNYFLRDNIGDNNFWNKQHFNMRSLIGLLAMSAVVAYFL